MSCKVSFIGLGVMGYPMAGYISKAGHNVTVYNRTKTKAEKWIKDYKGNLAETPKEAAKDCDFVFTCVGKLKIRPNSRQSDAQVIVISMSAANTQFLFTF